MNECIRRLLAGKEDNYILPFFWQHGEEEAVLREMMAAIDGANCRAVCVESRPHPDFCGEKWWKDMDVILDEARKRGMKVWILDDSHFPTGYANGAVKTAPQSLARQGIFMRQAEIPAESAGTVINLRAAGLMDPPKKVFTNPIEEAMASMTQISRVFDDDRVLSAVLIGRDGSERDVTDRIRSEELPLDGTEEAVSLRLIVASRNTGCHRDYINMTDRESVKLLLDAVYEPHWQHYAADFGETIEGFFSDEPELGNGILYEKFNTLGQDRDLPWGAELEKEVKQALGEDWLSLLPRLWSQEKDAQTARVHYVYMDILTRLVEKNFSFQLGDWCRSHGVKYIGHVIEDDGQHCRTGTSLGHYFRGLRGQDMAGIDDIGGQVYPQGEDEPKMTSMLQPRSGEFFHYALAKLAQSAAAIEPEKQGRAMCEIFGNYGWEEGVRLEKYLADHFLVRGINYYVPHAFTGKPFPDPDCPPHFYAHGHNPQYRHFGELIKYMNRAATLISSGPHRVPAAVLYHGEAEWCDKDAMPVEVPIRRLYDRQIDCHVLPADLFARPDEYKASLARPFKVNRQEYEAVIVPGCESICEAAAAGLNTLAQAGLPVVFAQRKPSFVSDTGKALPEALDACPVVPLEMLADQVLALGVNAPAVTPENNRLRLLEIMGDTPVVMLVNEGTEAWSGTLRLPYDLGDCFLYDAWSDRCFEAQRSADGCVSLTVEPLKSLFLVGGDCEVPFAKKPVPGREIPLAGWKRQTCEGSEYPHFSEAVETALPDGQKLAQEQPEFSGFVRYETVFSLDAAAKLLLTVESADEGVEVFLNGESAGIQIAPPFAFELEGRAGENLLRIEVATTLERECYPMLDGYRKMLAKPPACASGITGAVRLCEAE